MERVIRGRVVRLPQDSISTDVIAPTEWLLQARARKDVTVITPHAFEAIRPGFHESVEPGDIFVVGRNFGCGSHREEAVRLLRLWGVQAIIAESLGRIYFRNAIASGMPAVNCPGALEMFGDGDEAQIDLAGSEVSNLTTGARQAVKPFPETVEQILEAGGILPVLKARLDAEGAAT